MNPEPKPRPETHVSFGPGSLPSAYASCMASMNTASISAPVNTAMLAYAKTAGTLTDFETTVKLVREIGNPRIKLEATEHIVSIHDDLTIDLQQALELMREMPVIDDRFIWRLFCDVNEEDKPALRAWIDQAVAEGRIKDVSGDPFHKFEDGMRRR